MAAKKNDATDDLLDSLNTDLDTEVADLLDTLNDAGAPAWVPDEAGEGVQGIVTSVSDQEDEFNPGEKVPVVTIEMADGEKVRVIGFGSVLRREIADADAQPGDTFAVKYFGEREILKGRWAGKNYKLYKVAVRRAK